jgi:hypothetical protein
LLVIAYLTKLFKAIGFVIYLLNSCFRDATKLI